MVISHRVHKVATATFWSTLHHDKKKYVQAGEGAGALPPPFLVSTITYKVVMYTPAERADSLPLFLLYPYMYSVVNPNWE
jgi:hypothetical protein